MPELVFSPEADEFLSTIEADETRVRCAARIHAALDRLEADPGDERNRRRRFQTIALWGISVVCEDDEWLILWERLDDELVIVHHIVAAP